MLLFTVMLRKAQEGAAHQLAWCDDVQACFRVVDTIPLGQSPRFPTRYAHTS